jgi:PIN domain nuclease of toxin-antitoxin system
MRLLLDTHVLLWWLADDRRLKSPERHVIAHRDALVYVSAVSIWEITIKKGLGRLELDNEVLERELETGDMNELPVRWRHAKIAGALPTHHQDPFDRMLIAQAQTEGLTLVTYDRAFQPYDVAVLPSA